MRHRRNKPDAPEGRGPWELPEPDDQAKRKIERFVDETLEKIAEQQATDPMAGDFKVGRRDDVFDVSLNVVAPRDPRAPGAPLGRGSYHITSKDGSWGGSLAHAGSPIAALLDRAGIGSPLRISIKVDPPEAAMPFVSYVWSIPSARASFLFDGVYWSPRGPYLEDEHLIEQAAEGVLGVSTLFVMHDHLVALAFVTALERVGSWPGSPASKVTVIDWQPGRVTRDHRDQLPSVWPI